MVLQRKWIGRHSTVRSPTEALTGLRPRNQTTCPSVLGTSSRLLPKQTKIGGLARSTGSRASSHQTTWKRSHHLPALRPIPLLVILTRYRHHHPSRIRAAQQQRMNPSIMGLPRVDTRLSHHNLIVHIRHHQVNQYYPSKLLLSKRRLQSTTVVTAHQSVPEIFT